MGEEIFRALLIYALPSSSRQACESLHHPLRRPMYFPASPLESASKTQHSGGLLHFSKHDVCKLLKTLKWVEKLHRYHDMSCFKLPLQEKCLAHSEFP